MSSRTNRKKTAAPKKTTAKKTVKPLDTPSVVFLLDESGSMEACRDATISGFNEYLQTVWKQTPTAKLSLTLFHSAKFEPRYVECPLEEVKQLTKQTYVPGAATPLFDAIGHTICEVEKSVGRKRVLMIIVTDGQENASREFTREHILRLIKRKETDGWSFVFLGANQDAWATGEAFGMHQGNVRTYTLQDTPAVFAGLASATTTYMDMARSAKFTTSNAVLSSSNYDQIVKEPNKPTTSQP